jgi:protein-tyrosine phosphatase
MVLPKTVLFICTGNYYRSRFAEYLFNALAEQEGLHWRATSRGLKTQLVDGEGPISKLTVEQLAARHIHLAADIRLPIQLTENDLVCADLVIAMKDAEHRAMMREQFHFWADSINYWTIDDLDCKAPQEALLACDACVKTLVDGLLVEQNNNARRGIKIAA